MVLAHTGHWLVNLAYAMPVAVLVGWVGWAKGREALQRRRGGPAAEPMSAREQSGASPD